MCVCLDVCVCVYDDQITLWATINVQLAEVSPQLSLLRSSFLKGSRSCRFPCTPNSLSLATSACRIYPTMHEYSVIIDMYVIFYYCIVYISCNSSLFNVFIKSNNIHFDFLLVFTVGVQFSYVLLSKNCVHTYVLVYFVCTCKYKYVSIFIDSTCS